MMRRKENTTQQSSVMMYANEKANMAKKNNAPAKSLVPALPLPNGPIYYDGPFEKNGVLMA